MRTAALLLALAAAPAAPAAAAPPKVPEAVAAEPGDPVRITVEAPDDAEIGLQPAFPDDPKVLFTELRGAPGRRVFLFLTKKPGVYPLVFWAKGETTGATCVITVGPPPKPPAPPTPPTPPAPPSPLRAKLQAAYAADPGDPARKEAARRDLVELYRVAVEVAKDPQLATAVQLRDKLKAASTLLATDLVGTRTAVAETVAAVVPDAPLTDATRAAAAQVFREISDALNW